MDFDAKVIVKEDSVSAKAATATYRIIQEAVNNIVKYSGAQKARIEVGHENGHLKVQIEDNGVGFDLNSAKSNSGNGLNNMSERAKAINGILEISSTKGKGTVISAKIPVN